MNVYIIYAMGLANSEYGLNATNVQRFIKDTTRQFDIVISEQFYQETWLMFGHKFNAPLVTINTFGCTDFMDYAQGLVTPWAYVPHTLLNFDDRMSFGERAYNVFLHLFDRAVRTFYYMPKNNQLAQKYFANLQGKYFDRWMGLDVACVDYVGDEAGSHAFHYIAIFDVRCASHASCLI